MTHFCGAEIIYTKQWLNVLLPALHSEQLWFCLHSSVVGQATCILLVLSCLKHIFEKNSVRGLSKNLHKDWGVNNTCSRTEILHWSLLEEIAGGQCCWYLQYWKKTQLCNSLRLLFLKHNLSGDLLHSKTADVLETQICLVMFALVSLCSNLRW